jgi:hypothetical protein
MQSKLDTCRTGGGYDIVKANKIKKEYIEYTALYE